MMHLPVILASIKLLF